MTERRRITIVTDREAGGEQGAPRFRLERSDGTPLSLPRDCEGEPTTTEDGGTRIIICDMGAGSPAQRAERLERVRLRLVGDEYLGVEEASARAAAALEREIARLRAQAE